MNLPKFLLADNSEYPEAVYVVHTEYPQFILNMVDDDIVWLEEFSEEDLSDLEKEAEELICLAGEFYDKELGSYQA